MIITPTVAFGTLLLAGMPRPRCVEFVAIAECESSLNTDAVSPAGALGLWQIMPFNFAPLGLSVGDWRNPDINARAATLLSGHGSNCAAWDTCYRDIQATGRYTFLNWPEAGSCAYNNLLHVAVVTGTSGLHFAGAPPMPGVDGTLDHTVSVMQTLAHRTMPANGRQLRAVTAAVGRLYTR